MVITMTTWKGKNKSIYHRKRRLATVVWLTSFRNKCLYCGESDSVVLDFHHRDSKEKSFNLIGSLCYSRSRKSILKEISKCDILCSNCHRKEEHRLRTLKLS